MTDMNKVNIEELGQAAGGNDGLGSGVGGGWVNGTVHGVQVYDNDPSSCLTLRNAPNGEVLYNNAGKPLGWKNGDSIPVFPQSRQGNWIKAKKGNVTGWTNTNYVWY